MLHFNLLLKRTAAMAVAGAFGISAMAQAVVPGSDAPVFRSMSPSTHFAATEVPQNAHNVVVPARKNARPGLSALGTPRALKSRPGIIPAAGERLPALAGSVTVADSWPYEEPPIGVYALPEAAGKNFTLLAEGPDATGGGVVIGDKYYCTNYYNFSGYLYANVDCYDMSTWERLSHRDGESGLIALDVALDPTDNNVYGFFYNDNVTGYEFGTINYETLTRTVICDLDRTMVAIAIDNDGTVYGIDREMARDADNIMRTVSSSLYKIDKETGAMSLVGKTGQLPFYVSSAVIDPATGRMFWTVSGQDGARLCEVDKATGAAKVVMEFADNEEVTGLYVQPAAAADDAPASVSGLTAEFADGSLSGKVRFTAPAVTFGGDPATGALTYTVTANGVEIATGNTTCGAFVDASVSVDAAGMYEIAAYVSNAAGNGPAAKLSMFIGKGTPSMPVVTASWSGGRFHVEWAPVTTSADGGYINPADVRYDIMRMPDEVLLDHDIAATSIDMPYPEPENLESFYFLVGAKYDGKQSQTAVSNLVVLGALSTPYSQDFSNIDELNAYTILDGNADGKVWSWYNGQVYLPYSKETQCDDWFILPPMRLEGGRVYKFTIEAYAGYAAYPERFEVKYGTANNADAMTSTVIAPTTLTNIVAKAFDGDIAPEKSGIYYIGVHGISDADMYSLYVKSINIGTGVDDNAPAAVEDFTATPDPDGLKKVTLSFTAPTQTFAGQPLGALTDIVISRSGRALQTIENPAPGQKISFEDTPQRKGYYTYEVTSSNEYGRSAAVSATVYVGINVPAAPTDVVLTETDEPGVVTLSWTAPTTDVDGLPLNPDLVTYTIVQATNHDDFVALENVKETTVTFRAMPEGEQDFIYFAVFAATEAGYSDTYASSVMKAIGTPAAYPFLESFADGDFSMDFGVSGNGGSWSTYGDASGIVSIEEDNGYMGMKGEYVDARSGIYTGKISLEGAVAPVLSFYTYNVPPESASDGRDTNTIEISVSDGSKSSVVKSFVIGEEFGDNYGWNKVSVPLTGYAGCKNIELRLTVTTGNCVYTFFDRLRIGEAIDNNLIAGRLRTPDRVKVGNDFTASVNVLNDGDKAADNYRVQLMCNGKEIASQVGVALLPGDKKAVEFTVPTGPVSDESLVIGAKVVYENDAVPEDNTTGDATVKVVYPNLPAPEALQGRSTGDAVKLSWIAPDMSLAMPAAIEDDFESYAPYANSGVGSWVFVDIDKGGIGGIQDFQIPGIDRNSEQSFWVMTSEIAPDNGTFAAHSGTQYLCQMYAAVQNYPVMCDDWAISPELYGKRQEITFFARSYVSIYPETFEVYYSTGSVNPDDFIFLDVVEYASSAWTEYNFTVPDGARRFAIRCISTDCFMLFVDDFSYIPAGATLDLELKGYNLYRDGVKVSTLAADELSAVDVPDTESAYSYRITAVYNRGESRPSNVAEVDYSAGIAEAGVPQPVVVGLKGVVQVRNAAGMPVSIFAVDGKAVHVGSGDATVSLMPGVYTVRVASTSHKVLVK